MALGCLWLMELKQHTELRILPAHDDSSSPNAAIAQFIPSLSPDRYLRFLSLT